MSRSSSAPTKRPSVLKTSLIVMVVASAAFLAWFWGLNIIHYLTTDWRESAAFWIPIFVTFAIMGAMLFYYKRSSASAHRYTPYLPFILVAGIGVIVAVLFAMSSSYFRLNSYYHDSVTYEQETIPSDYAERTPYEVAVSTATRSMMNTTGEGWYTKSLANEGVNGEWNTLIIARGINQGYESVQNASYPLYGTTTVDDVKFCKFDGKKANLRHGGAFPENNLSRAIFGMVPVNVSFDSYDSYGYCNDKGVPIVVTPLKQIDGLMYPTWSYYGLAVYNGATGELDIVTNTDEISEYPGPVYAQSLASTQRMSLVAGGDFWEWFHGTFGYETATGNSDVQLKVLDSDETNYVTAMRPLGSSTSIVAVTEIRANAYIGENGLNPLVVNELPETHYRPANSTLEDELRSQYSNMPDIVSSNIQVFEITAGTNGQWVVSLGREQSVIYRAYVTPGVNEIVLMNDKGEPVGNMNIPQTGEPGTVNSNLSEMSDAELIELGKAVFDELATR